MLGKHVRINHTPFFLISWEASEKHPIYREIGVKTPHFPVFLRKKSSPDKRPKMPPFPRKWESIRMRPLVHLSGGRGW